MPYNSYQLTRLPKPWNLPHNGRLILIFTELCKVFPEGLTSHQLAILLKTDRKYISLGLKKLMESETIECKGKVYYAMLTVPDSMKNEKPQHEKRKLPLKSPGKGEILRDISLNPAHGSARRPRVH